MPVVGISGARFGDRLCSSGSGADVLDSLPRCFAESPLPLVLCSSCLAHARAMLSMHPARPRRQMVAGAVGAVVELQAGAGVAK
jgi:hypothetical protein